LTGGALTGATLALAEIGDVSRTLPGVSAARCVVFAFAFATFAAFADVSRGVDGRCASAVLDAAPVRLRGAVAGVEALTRLDRLSDCTAATDESQSDTCATAAICESDGTTLVAFAFAGAVRLMGFSVLD
jgi:hypothetical protein